MTSRQIRHIMQGYGYDVAALHPVQKGYRNESNPVLLTNGMSANLILYKREPDILRTVRRARLVSRHAHEGGLPVRIALDERIARLKTGAGVRYAGLYEYLPGYTIPWDGYTRRHLRLLGTMMSNLHAALVNVDTHGFPNVTTQYQAIISRMRHYFNDRSVTEALQQKLDLRFETSVLAVFEKILSHCAAFPRQQVLHMDFVRSNILFSDSPRLHISGVIDFEKAAVGHPVFDVARTIAFLLVDCQYASPAKIYQKFLLNGYQKRGASHLSDTFYAGTATLLERLVTLFLIYDFYKFVHHNPYESLQRNQHFVRTRAILLERSVITTTDS